MTSIAEEIVFWVKVAVGVLVCWLALTVFDRIGDLFWQFKSQPVSGYGSDGTSEAVWTALREVCQAFAAIGTAVMLVVWSTLRTWLRKKWHRDENQIPTPAPNPGPEPEDRRLLDALRRLRKHRRG
jgi:hypothetical protein